jgi:hypothetical protein
VLVCRSQSQPPWSPAALRRAILVAGIAIEALVVVLLGRVPPLQQTFGFQPLGATEFLFVVAVLPLIPIAGEIARRSMLRRGRSPAPDSPS